jgi:predicted transcriptional regulator
MLRKKPLIHIRLTEDVYSALKDLAVFKNCSMNLIVFQSIVEKLERERRHFISNEIPKR